MVFASGFPAEGAKRRDNGGKPLLGFNWLAPRRRRYRKKKSAPESAQSAETERRKLLANGAGLTRRCGDRLARLDHGGVSRAGAVGDARGKANADDQRREDERHCHHLQVGKAAGGRQRKIVHDTLPSRGKRREPLAWCGSGGSS